MHLRYSSKYLHTVFGNFVFISHPLCWLRHTIDGGTLWQFSRTYVER